MKRKSESISGSCSEQSGSNTDSKYTKLNSNLTKKFINNGIYYTKIEGLPEKANENTFSLFELINKINPISSIHFNYCIDPSFILNQYPRRCRTFPVTLIVGQPDGAALKEAAKCFKNVIVKTAPIPFPYGTHHTKLSLFESEDAIHVLISTANLIKMDYSLKTQCFFYCRAPFNEKKCTSQFGSELLAYLDNAYLKNGGSNFINYWIDRIRDGGADFSSIKDRLVTCCPGRYTGQRLSDFGHMRLRKLLSEKFDAIELKKLKTMIGQFSSIGSLGSQAQSWLCDEFLRSLCGGNTLNMNPTNLKLIYPSAENVRCSLEGYKAGNSLPYNSKVHSKQLYLHKFLHQWKSEELKRTKAMPHVKSYTALDENETPQWMLITSANLSQAAWGKLEKNSTQLFCRSYELGVLICLKDHPELDVLKTPFDLPLLKYTSKDEPYLIDLNYEKPDEMGHHCVLDYF